MHFKTSITLDFKIKFRLRSFLHSVHFVLMVNQVICCMFISQDSHWWIGSNRMVWNKVFEIFRHLTYMVRAGAQKENQEK